MRNNQKRLSRRRTILEPHPCNTVQSVRQGSTPPKSPEEAYLRSRTQENSGPHYLHSRPPHHPEEWRIPHTQEGRHNLSISLAPLSKTDFLVGFCYLRIFSIHRDPDRTHLLQVESVFLQDARQRINDLFADTGQCSPYRL